MDQPVATEFDEQQAAEYWPNDNFVKVAILMTPATDDAITELAATFGPQAMRGPFYLVANGDTSYGAAKAEFEAANTHIGEQRFVKTAPVDAYRTTSPTTVVTVIGDNVESTVDANAGDWIVRQTTGEIMCLTPESFDERYRIPPDTNQALGLALPDGLGPTDAAAARQELLDELQAAGVKVTPAEDTASNPAHESLAIEAAINFAIGVSSPAAWAAAKMVWQRFVRRRNARVTEEPESWRDDRGYL